MDLARTEMPPFARDQILEASRCYQLGRHDEAERLILEVAKTLAQTAPELGALLVATRLGCRKLTISQDQVETATTTTSKRVLGIEVASTRHTKKTVTKKTRTYDFS